MANRQVLFAEDETFGEAVQDFLQLHGFAVSRHETVASLMKAAESLQPDVILLDYSLPDGNALEVLPKLKAMHPAAAAIVLTGRGSIELAVECMQVGADHFLTKPVRLDALLATVNKVLSVQRDARNARSARSKSQTGLNPFLGSSRSIRDLEEQARQLLAAQSPICIHGETGVGKGVLAKWLHQNGPRAEEPFVDLNCAGLSRELLESELFGHEKGAFTGAAAAKEGLFEVAHRGTVFLDEVGDVDLMIQPKLLKAVEEKRFRRVGDTRERQVDIHLLSASHADLRAKVAAGTFREDLYYRLSALPLRVPALRERAADIPEVTEQLLKRIKQDLAKPELEITGEAMKALQSYTWPGNIRELRNVLERAALFAKSAQIKAEHLRLGEGSPAEKPNGSLQGAERDEIRRVLFESNWNVSAAAKRLGISRSGLYIKIRQYELRPQNGYAVHD